MAKIHPTRSELKSAFEAHLEVYKQEKDKSSYQLLLFYAVECGLKERYLFTRTLNSTSDFSTHPPAIPPGRWGEYGAGHDILEWARVLSIPAHALTPFTPTNAEPILQLHEKLRYGVPLSPHCETQVSYIDSMASYLETNRP